MSAGQNGTLRSRQYRNWHLKICVCTSELQLWSWGAHGRTPFVFPPCLRGLYLSAPSRGGGKEQSAMLCSWAPVLLPVQSEPWGRGVQPASSSLSAIPGVAVPASPSALPQPSGVIRQARTASSTRASWKTSTLPHRAPPLNRQPSLHPAPAGSPVLPGGVTYQHTQGARVLLNTLAYSLLGKKEFPTLATHIP